MMKLSGIASGSAIILWFKLRTCFDIIDINNEKENKILYVQKFESFFIFALGVYLYAIIFCN